MKTVTGMVQVERDGKTHLVPQEFPVPRDYDAIALGTVRATTSLAVAGAVTWSTVAIGDLLAGVAPTWAAYLVAGVFDLAWITCMTLEWLSRYDRSRARLPIACGWVALVLSVALITLHGASDGGSELMAGASAWTWRGTVLGICGGAVSVIAKGMWTVVMRHSSVTMDKASQAWLDAERRELNAGLAMTAARRQLNRTRALIAVESAALSSGQRDTWTEIVRDSPAEQDRTPDTSPVLSQDSGTGQRDTGQDRTVVRRTVLDTGQDNTADLSGRLSQRAFVRGLLSADPSLSDTDLSAAVRSEYGQDTKADSIRKAIQRARGDLSRAV